MLRWNDGSDADLPSGRPHDPAQCVADFLRSPEAVERLAKWLHVDGRDKICGLDSTGCRFGHQRRAEAILAALAEDA